MHQIPGFHHSIGPGGLAVLAVLAVLDPNGGAGALDQPQEQQEQQGGGGCQYPFDCGAERTLVTQQPSVARTEKRSCHSAEYPYDVVSQSWQVLLHHGPHGIEVNAEVGVDKAIARSGDLPPGNGGLACRQVSTQVLDRLADDFELPDHRTLGLTVCHEGALAFHREARDRIDGALNTCPRKSLSRSFIEATPLQVCGS